MKKLIVLGFVFAGFAILGVSLILKRPHVLQQKIFVNETSDHRFDESIEVSILAAEKRTGVQNAVVITDRFDALEFQKEAAKLYKILKLGEANGGRAILYLFSPKSRNLKIEVGYALEAELPDVTVHRFEEAAKGFTFVDRYQDFWAELINTLNIEIFEKSNPAQAERRVGELETKFRFLSGGAGVFATDYSARIEDLVKQMGPAPMGTEFDGSENLRESLARYLASMGSGVGAEKIGVLSRTSRFFRKFTPMTEMQLKRNWNMYEKAGIDAIFEDGGFGYVFYRAHHPVLPIVLVKEDGVWKVDEPRSWIAFQRFEDSQEVFLKFPFETSNPEMRLYLKQRFGKPLYRAPKIAANSYSTDSEFNAYLNYYWLERGAYDIRGQSEAELWARLDIANNLGHYSEFLKIYAKLLKLYPADIKMKNDFEFYRKTFEFEGDSWRHQI